MKDNKEEYSPLTAEYLKKFRDSLKEIKSDKIQRWHLCKTEFVKVSEYSWEPVCKCYKAKIQLSIG